MDLTPEQIQELMADIMGDHPDLFRLGGNVFDTESTASSRKPTPKGRPKGYADWKPQKKAAPSSPR
jgi:hypothetical protein